MLGLTGMALIMAPLIPAIGAGVQLSITVLLQWVIAKHRHIHVCSDGEKWPFPQCMGHIIKLTFNIKNIFFILYLPLPVLIFLAVIS